MLLKDHKSYTAVQTFCPTPGQNNLTTGTFKGSIVRCIEDGDIEYNFANETTETFSMLAADDYAIPNGCTVTIVSGTFHVSK